MSSNIFNLSHKLTLRITVNILTTLIIVNSLKSFDNVVITKVK